MIPTLIAAAADCSLTKFRQQATRSELDVARHSRLPISFRSPSLSFSPPSALCEKIAIRRRVGRHRRHPARAGIHFESTRWIYDRLKGNHRLDPRSLYGYYISRSNVITALAPSRRLGCVGNVGVVAFSVVKKPRTSFPPPPSLPLSRSLSRCSALFRRSAASRKKSYGSLLYEPTGRRRAHSRYYILRRVSFRIESQSRHDIIRVS